MAVDIDKVVADVHKLRVRWLNKGKRGVKHVFREDWAGATTDLLAALEQTKEERDNGWAQVKEYEGMIKALKEELEQSQKEAQGYEDHVKELEDEQPQAVGLAAKAVLISKNEETDALKQRVKELEGLLGEAGCHITHITGEEGLGARIDSALSISRDENGRVLNCKFCGKILCHDNNVGACTPCFSEALSPKDGE